MTKTRSHKLLVVGVGSIGERHLRCFQQTGRCELAFCEPHDKLREAISQQYGVSSVFASVQDALDQGKYDAAVIATPAPLHVPISNQLAQAGCHLLIEKPLGTSLDGIDALRNTIAKQSLCVAVGYVQRAHPALQAVKEAIDSRRFGQPLQVKVSLGHPFKHFRPAYRDIYFARHEEGGGAIQDGLTHFYNSIEWLVGPADRLVTDAAHQQLEGVTVEDTVHSLVRHGNVLASYAMNMYQPSNDSTCTVVCDSGTVQCDFRRLRWSWIQEPAGAWNHQSVEVADRDALYIIQANVFLDSIEGRTNPLCTLDEAVQTLRVNLASLRSVAEGSWQVVQ